MALLLKSGDDVAPAFLKMGFLGDAGSGKSKTATKVAIGLVKRMRAAKIEAGNKPVLYFDTEDGVAYVAPDFRDAGVELKIASTKAFADLLDAMRWAESNASVMIIDSITHPWRELVASYLKKKQRTFLQIDDWAYIKGPHGWAQFSEFYVNSKLHIIMCGRAGDDLEQYTDENGKRQLEKVGVKMKTETETAFEPSLLVLMEKKMDLRTKLTEHMATVMKDRADKINGAQMANPGFESFLPHIQVLQLGGAHNGIATGDSQHILKTERRDYTPTQRRIIIDKIQTQIALKYPGQTAAEKTAKLKLILGHFNTVWTEIEEVMPLPDLIAGYNTLFRELNDGKPSEYESSAPVQDGAKPEINDSLPDHSAPPMQASEPSQPQEPEPKPEAPAADFSKMDINEVFERLAGCETIQQVKDWGLSCARLNVDTAVRTSLHNAMSVRQSDLKKAESEEATRAAAGEKPTRKQRQPKAAAETDETMLGG